MGPITKELYSQIKGWRVYSIIAPAVFCAVSGILYVWHGTPWLNILYTGVAVLAITCVSWWHWSLSTMMTMLAIMKDTDDHFKQVNDKLENLEKVVSGKPSLFLVKPVDKDK